MQSYESFLHFQGSLLPPALCCRGVLGDASPPGFILPCPSCRADSGCMPTLGSMPGLWGADGAHSTLQGTELQPAE